MAFENWSPNPANNSLVDGITWSNGMLPSQIDDSGRQMMADMAAWRNSPSLPSLTVGGVALAPANYALLSGASFTNPIAAPLMTAVAPTFGQISLSAGNTTVSGYVLFKAASGTNLGYIGQQTASGSINYVAQNGNGHTFSGGSVNAVNGLVVNGSAVWHAGNFNPNNYALLTGAAFTGAISATSANVSGAVQATSMTVNGNAVWHAGNFSPSNYAALTGATFSGGIAAASLAVTGGVQAASVFIGPNGWSVADVGGRLTFSYQGVAKFSVDSAGTGRFASNVIGNTTP